MAPLQNIAAFLTALIALASAAPIASVTAIEEAKPPTVLYNHEGGLDGRDVSTITNAKPPTVLYNREGGLDGHEWLHCPQDSPYQEKVNAYIAYTKGNK